MSARASSLPRGGLFHLHVHGDMQEVGVALAKCPRVRRIVDTVGQRKGLDRTSRDAVLLSEVWIRLRPYIPFADAPENIYSLVWRIAEFAAMDLRREHASKEVLECEMSPEEHDLVMGRYSDDGSSLDHIEAEVDRYAAQKRFQAKLLRVGWDPDADPTNYQGITAPGRKASTRTAANNAGQIGTKINNSL